MGRFVGVGLLRGYMSLLSLSQVLGSGWWRWGALFLVVSAEVLCVLFCFKMFCCVIPAQSFILVTCCIYMKCVFGTILVLETTNSTTDLLGCNRLSGKLRRLP